MTSFILMWFRRIWRIAVQTGSIVLVPFGKGGRTPALAWWRPLQECEDVGKLKTIFDAAPEQARLSGELLDLARDLRETTFCTYYEAVESGASVWGAVQSGAERRPPVPAKAAGTPQRHALCRQRSTGAEKSASHKSSRLRWICWRRHRARLRRWKAGASAVQCSTPFAKTVCCARNHRKKRCVYMKAPRNKKRL